MTYRLFCITVALPARACVRSEKYQGGNYMHVEKCSLLENSIQDLVIYETGQGPQGIFYIGGA